ncbi:MAG: sulfotransferase [Gammaproteobacteria bacterium]|nr:sulfotransferase [Gammaproteobacteria bacterium]
MAVTEPDDPAPRAGAAAAPDASAAPLSPAAFRRHALRRAAGNFALLKHRHCAGQLVSMHQAGTHWLKFMLANALSYQYATPPPRYNHANDIIGGPRDAVVHPQLPRLLSSHSLPHPAMRWGWLHACLQLPPYVVLVRDLRDSLVSNYAKWQARYDVPFAVYVRGDQGSKRYNSDIWWCIRFMNAWGALAKGLPQRVTVVRYEDLRGDPAHELARVARAFGLALDNAALAHGIAVSSKAHMAVKEDPARPPGAVRESSGDPRTAYDRAAREFVGAVCARYLEYDFGYDFARW